MNLNWDDVKDYQMHTECAKALRLEDCGYHTPICRKCQKRFWYEMTQHYKPTSLIANEERGGVAG